MRKLFFSLAFVLVGTITFASNSSMLFNFDSTEKIELMKQNNNVVSLTSKIDIKKFMRYDHCTITVSTVDSDGNTTNSVTVTNYDGDCKAAERLAYRILGLVQ